MGRNIVATRTIKILKQPKLYAFYQYYKSFYIPDRLNLYRVRFIKG